jgi:hypothetical protein
LHSPGGAPPNFDALKAFRVGGHLDHRVENSKVMPSRAPKPWGLVSGESIQ